MEKTSLDRQVTSLANQRLGTKNYKNIILPIFVEVESCIEQGCLIGRVRGQRRR
jgi:hypothetical protein